MEPSFDNSEEEKDEVIANDKKFSKGRSWVYNHAEKVETSDCSWFQCLYKLSTGELCKYKVRTSKGQTSIIANHLRTKHDLKPPEKEIQKALDHFPEMLKHKKEKSFREAFCELVAKQYLPFSLIEEKALQDSYLAFHREIVKQRVPPTFFTDKAIASDIKKKADEYVQEIAKRFTSKLSLCMDLWKGPNTMPFLGITFAYLDENYDIKRGLLDLIKINDSSNIAKSFQTVMDSYVIKKNMIGGIMQGNASSCGNCTNALVEMGYDRHVFFGCLLHALNLACQAAIEVYDPFRKTKTSRIGLISDIENFSGSEDSHDEEDLDYQEEEDYSKELKGVQNQSNVIANVAFC